MLRLTHCVAAGLALSLSACAAGRQAGPFAELAYDQPWDRDADGLVDRVELAIALDQTDTYNSWDLNGDRGLDRTEWYAGMGDTDLDWGSWEVWDTDRDQRIWEDEFADGIFRMWDRNADDTLDAEELRAGLDLI